MVPDPRMDAWERTGNGVRSRIDPDRRQGNEVRKLLARQFTPQRHRKAERHRIPELDRLPELDRAPGLHPRPNTRSAPRTTAGRSSKGFAGTEAGNPGAADPDRGGAAAQEKAGLSRCIPLSRGSSASQRWSPDLSPGDRMAGSPRRGQLSGIISTALPPLHRKANRAWRLVVRWRATSGRRIPARQGAPESRPIGSWERSPSC